MWTAYLLAAGLGYLLGSFPTGYLVGRAKGVDIRELGSKNIGATNVVRVLGKGPGFLVFGVDALKGWIAVCFGQIVGIALHENDGTKSPYPGDTSIIHGSAADYERFAREIMLHDQHETVLLAITAAIACILGHNFPVWLRFKGGKGIATSAGVLLGLMPLSLAVGGAVWAVAFFTLRYVSVASLLAAVSIPVTVGVLWKTGRADAALFAFSLLAAALAIWRHRGNIQRLLAGTEPRFERRRPTTSAPVEPDAAP